MTLRKTNLSTQFRREDHPVTVEYDCRGKRVRKECDNAFEARTLWKKKDRQGLNPKIVRAEHVHEWGLIELAPFTGNPHRKCQVPGCKVITLDLDEDFEEACDHFDSLPSLSDYPRPDEHDDFANHHRL